MIRPWTEKDCDRCGIRYQFTRSEPRPAPVEYVCPECAAYERGAKEAEAELERVKTERDEDPANYEWMVRRVADKKLDGYRDLGARAAKAEAERDHFKAQLREAQERGLDAEARAEEAQAKLDEWRARALSAAEKAPGTILRVLVDPAERVVEDAHRKALDRLRGTEEVEPMTAVALWRTRALQLAAEMRKHRPTIRVVYDRDAWDLAKQLGESK
jgi:hypothetical protein